MMDRTRKIRLISNSFYNAGLERAKRRDLTGAVEYLKKCLNLNKYHIDARNLLGLIIMRWVRCRRRWCSGLSA